MNLKNKNVSAIRARKRLRKEMALKAHHYYSCRGLPAIEIQKLLRYIHRRGDIWGNFPAYERRICNVLGF